MFLNSTLIHTILIQPSSLLTNISYKRLCCYFENKNMVQYKINIRVCILKDLVTRNKKVFKFVFTDLYKTFDDTPLRAVS